MASSGTIGMDVGTFLREEAQETAQAPTRLGDREFELVLLDAMGSVGGAGAGGAGGGAQWDVVSVELDGRKGFLAHAAGQDVGNIDVVESVLCSVVCTQLGVEGRALVPVVKSAVMSLRSPGASHMVLIFANVDKCGDAAVVQLVLQVLGELSVAAVGARRIVVTSAEPIVLPSDVSTAWTHLLTAPVVTPPPSAHSSPTSLAPGTGSIAAAADTPATASKPGSGVVRPFAFGPDHVSASALATYLLDPDAHALVGALSGGVTSLNLGPSLVAAASPSSSSPAMEAPRRRYDASIDPTGILRRAEELARHLVGDLVDDGPARRTVFGRYSARWYKKPLPLSSGEGFVPLLMTPYVGRAAERFHSAVSSLPGCGSNAETLVVAQASGSGKTKLPYVMAQREEDPLPTLLVRVASGGGAATFTGPWNALQKVVKHIHARSDWTSVKMEREGRNQVNVLLGCYALWARVVLRAVLRAWQVRGGDRPLSMQQKAVTLLLAVRNGEGDNGVKELYSVAAYDRALEAPTNWADDQLCKLSEDLSTPQICLFIDEAQLCKGVLQGCFHTTTEGVPRLDRDLLHAVATAAAGLSSYARVALCGTDPNMGNFTRDVSTAQGGPKPFSVATHVSAEDMLRSLNDHLHLVSPPPTMLLWVLEALEGRAANFFLEGWRQIVSALKETETEPSPHDDKALAVVTTRIVTAALERAGVLRTSGLKSVVKGFVEKAALSESNQVLNAVLWGGGLLQRTSGGWPDKVVETGLAIVPSDALAIDLEAEPLLHAALMKRLVDAKSLREVSGFAIRLREEANTPASKGVAWEKTVALHALIVSRLAPASLAAVLGMSPPGFAWPESLVGATVQVKRTVSAWDDAFSCLFDERGNPRLDALAVNFNVFAGPDLAFFATVLARHVLVLVQCRNVQEGSIADAVASVTLGRIGARVAKLVGEGGDAFVTRTRATRRARANVAFLRPQSASAKFAFDHAIRVVAHPFGFAVDAVERINAYNRTAEGIVCPILLAVRDAAAVGDSIFQFAAADSRPQLSLPASVSDADLAHVSLEGIISADEFAAIPDTDLPKTLSEEERQALGADSLEHLLVTRLTKVGLASVCKDVGLPPRVGRKRKEAIASTLVGQIGAWRAGFSARAGLSDAEVVLSWIDDAAAVGGGASSSAAPAAGGGAAAAGGGASSGAAPAAGGGAAAADEAASSSAAAAAGGGAA